MGIQLSKMFGMDIYSVEGEYIGKAYEFVIDLEEGKIYKVTLEPFKNVRSKKDVAELLKKKSIPYEWVVSVRDVIIVDQRKKAKAQVTQPKVPARRFPRSYLR